MSKQMYEKFKWNITFIINTSTSKSKQSLTFTTLNFAFRKLIKLILLNHFPFLK